VSPWLEVEAKLLEHPEVAEVAVLGLPDEAYGEVGAAVVVLRQDEDGRSADGKVNGKDTREFEVDSAGVKWRGLTLVHFLAQPEPFLTQSTP